MIQLANIFVCFVGKKGFWQFGELWGSGEYLERERERERKKDRERERGGEREREHQVDWCWLCSQVRKPAPPALKKQAAVAPQAPAAPVQVQYSLSQSIYSMLGYKTGRVGNYPRALETQGAPRVVCPTKTCVQFTCHKEYYSSCENSFIKSSISVSSTPTLSRVGMMWSCWSKWLTFIPCWYTTTMCTSWRPQLVWVLWSLTSQLSLGRS